MRRPITFGLSMLAASATLFASAGTARADENGPSGCNNNVCIYTAYTGSGYQVWGEFDHTNVQDGHLDFWGPGRPRVSSPNGYWPANHDTRRYAGKGSGKVCAEGWSRVGGKWNSVGLPCVTI
ncbi:hypothetical protein ACBJ59_00825 [Nonomuraea sp. MTCD27]|uniref:hypothetical protein n=1 Tax=Nonomuraea sp. MTCD27 TaxID=1676747 RepID=UPI0035BFE329